MDKAKLLGEIPAYDCLLHESLTDIGGEGFVLSHRKSGAKLMLILTEDENKVFNIAFRTPSMNSTGVAHIMEHSVLCGSREFPVKDPFVELVKGSLNTFLNAMTYPDKTCYPVSSCNDADFRNLMHVYLDAVFYPNIYTRPQIFAQEGWSYRLEDENGPLTLNGVVYNEMKGALSSPDSVLEKETMGLLFPDICYGFESGGDPKCIPSLTYEEFLDFHRTFYHPSNSYIYLYGKMDMAAALNWMDEQYLSHFDRLRVDSEIGEQKPFAAPKSAVRFYPVAESESEKDNAFLSYNVVTGKTGDALEAMAMEVLDYALLSAPGAPLKKELIEAGFGSDVYGSFEEGIAQCTFSVIARGADEGRDKEFTEKVRSILGRIAGEGVDRKSVQAAINTMEFRYREADFSSYPKGLIYGLDILETWLYSDEDPFARVKRLPVFKALKEKEDSSFYEDLIRDCLLDNPHRVSLTMVPKKGLTAKEEAELADRLEKKRLAMSDKERQLLVEKTRELAAYQESEESEEDLLKIPMLKREEIGTKAQRLTTREEDLEGTLLLVHPERTNGIGYVDVMYELDSLSLDEIHTLGLLKTCLGLVDTERFSYGELVNEINAATGGLNIGVEVFDRCDGEQYRAMFSMRGKALYEKIPFLFEMGREILFHSRLDDAKRVKEIVSQIRSSAQANLVSSGHSTAVLRAGSYAGAMQAFQDELAGIGYFKYIEDLEKHFDERFEALSGEMSQLLAKLLIPCRMIADYTGEEESLAAFKKELVSLREETRREMEDKGLSDTRSCGAPMLPCAVRNEGFLTAGQVQYVARVGHFDRQGRAYSARLEILKMILSYDYLWNNVRVRGGAYGTMCGFRRSGSGYFASYRDPHLHRTLKVFEGIPDYIRSFEADEREMTKYIIGAISSKDMPRTPSMQGSISKSAYFAGLTQEQVQREREEILSADDKDIRELAAICEEILSEDLVCVVGSERSVRAAGDVLKEIRPLSES